MAKGGVMSCREMYPSHPKRGVNEFHRRSALDHGKTSTVVTLSALYPLVTILLSIAFLHEKLSPRQGAGIVLALIASALLAG